MDVRDSGFEVLGVLFNGFFDPWVNIGVDMLSLELVSSGLV